MRAKIKERKEIAEGAMEVAFDLMGQELPFTAGQFFTLTLLNPPYTDERGNNRFLGITNTPSQKDSISILTRTGTSAFKKSLAELPIGTEVEIGALGGRLHLPADTSQPIAFIIGGIGIAPIISILRFIREQALPYKVTLVYSNKNKASAPFFAELESFAKENPNFRFIPTMTQDSEWQGEKRKIDVQFIKEYFPNPNEHKYFIAGTPRFSPAMFRVLKEAGVPMQNITMEIFTGY